MPAAFPANFTRGIPYSYYVIQLSPCEFERIDPANIVFRDEVWTVVEELPRS